MIARLFGQKMSKNYPASAKAPCPKCGRASAVTKRTGGPCFWCGGKRAVRAFLARISGPCPLQHRTPHRIWRYEDQRVIAECALCGRDVSEALADHPRAEPLDGPTITKRPLTQVEHLAQSRAPKVKQGQFGKTRKPA